ncbi:MAG TPA: biotin synthase BioB [Planctomycetota bacterium]|nr:biotin synthase BioB [Planctomycetota bacterium]
MRPQLGTRNAEPGTPFGLSQAVARAAESALAGRGIAPEAALELAGSAPLDELLFAAGRVREAHFGNRLNCCSILSVKTGRCSEDCKFCAQSGHYPTEVQATDLLDDAAVRRAAQEARDNRASALGLVSSGCGPLGPHFEAYCARLEAVRDEGLTVHASLGVIDAAGAKRLAALGVKAYNHNLETARSFFGQVCTTHSYDDRLATLEALRQAGIARCCGGIFGLGESWAQRIELGAELQRLGVERVPINFLNPIPGTPFESRPRLPAREALRIVAIFRLMLPKALIQVCGGRELVLGHLQPLAFAAGATGVILGNYLTTKGRPADEDLVMFRDLGLELVTETTTTD